MKPANIRGWAVTLAFLSLSAYAHWSDLAVAEIAVGEREVRMTLTFPTGLVAQTDDDRNGVLSTQEVGRHQSQLSAFFGGKIKMTSSGTEGQVSASPVAGGKPLPRLGPQRGTHSSLLLTYRWAEPVSNLEIDYNLFLPGVSTASSVATVLHEGKVQDVVFRPDSRRFALVGEAAPQTLASFVKLGVGHILSGWDHLLFVIALVALGGGLGYLLKVITAFTLAHSVTLILGTLGLVELPSRLIESMIALSIAYVAFENLYHTDTARLIQRRWIAAFGFGLFHGLGFAGILAEIELPKANFLLSLLSFNLGVEIGQLMVVIPAFLFLTLLARWRWQPTMQRAISLFAIVAGLFWFVQRAFLSA